MMCTLLQVDNRVISKQLGRYVQKFWALGFFRDVFIFLNQLTSHSKIKDSVYEKNNVFRNLMEKDQSKEHNKLQRVFMLLCWSMTWGYSCVDFVKQVQSQKYLTNEDFKTGFTPVDRNWLLCRQRKLPPTTSKELDWTFFLTSGLKPVTLKKCRGESVRFSLLSSLRALLH